MDATQTLYKDGEKEAKVMAEYRCTNCGYVTVADAAPDECQVCKHKKTFEKIKE